MATEDPIYSTTKGGLEGLIRGLIGGIADIFRSPEKPLKSLVSPAPDPDFVGRLDKIKETVKKLKDSNKGVYLHGGPGIGKSALARKVVNEKKIAKKFKSGVAWIDLDGDNLGQICNRVAAALSIGHVPGTPNEGDKMAALRAALKGQRILIVLNNADDPAAAAAEQFSEGIATQVLATSRDSMGLDVVELGPMDETEALELLSKKMPRGLPDDQAALLPRIAEKVGYNPLGLELAAGQLDGIDPSQLLASLEKKLLDPLTAVIETSYDRLDEKEQRLFTALGAFGGDFSLEAVQSLFDGDIALVLGAQVRRSLVERNQASGRYSLHPLIRQFCREKLGAWPQKVQTDLYKGMAIYYLAYALHHQGKALEDYDALELERPNIFSLLDWYCDHGPRDDRDWAAIIVDQNVALARFLDTRGFWQQRTKYGAAAIEAARDSGDKRRLSSITHTVAMVHQDQGNVKESEELYHESLKISRKLDNQQNIASTLHQLGWIAQDKGDYPDAERLYGESLDIKKELENQEGIASNLHQLGMISQAKGEYPEAERLYRESLDIERKLGNQQGIAQSLHQLGMLAQGKGDYSEAEKFYRDSLAITKELGDLQSMAHTLGQRGLMKETLGELKEAVDSFREALTIFERLGSPTAEQARKDLKRVEGKLVDR